MDNTYKVWVKKRWLREDEVALCPDGGLFFYDEREERYLTDTQIEEGCNICHAVGINDKNGFKLYAGDIIQNGDTQYIITWEKFAIQWHAWDFKAWAKGYYDAYIPLHELDGIGDDNCTPPCYPYPQFYNTVKVGSIYETPELCPEIFDGEEQPTRTRTIKSPPKPRPTSLKDIKEAVKKAPPKRVSAKAIRAKTYHHDSEE